MPRSAAGRDQRPPVGEGVELELVDRRSHLGDRQQRIEIVRREVADADRAREAAGERALYLGPRPHRVSCAGRGRGRGRRSQAEPLETALGLEFGIGSARVELRGHEDLLARHAAGADARAHGGLVLVALGRVDVAVAGLERAQDGALARLGLDELPDPESEQRQPHARRDLECASGSGRGNGWSAHSGSLASASSIGCGRNNDPGGRTHT